MYTVVFNKLKLLIVTCITLVERHTDERRIPLAIGPPKLLKTQCGMSLSLMTCY